MKYRFLFVVLALLIGIKGNSQSTETSVPMVQYATAYVTQPSSTKQPSIRVVYETGESEVILLEKYSSSEDRRNGGKKISATDLDNQINITAFINKLAMKNYVLKNIDFDVSSHNTKYTVLIFEKVIVSPLLKDGQN